ncbi:MAG: IPT/TIG domain-containing protein [Sedimentisphaerales bacterium]|nr:IPT/TIG domain-containing protein [Sedimentisphaerales bacterium]
MKMKHSYLYAILFLLVLLLPNGKNIHARLMINGYEPSELVQKTETICTATVLSTQSQWIDDHRGRHIYTNVELLIERTIKGNVSTNPLYIEVVGGTVDDITERVSHSPVFREAEHVLLFLEGPSGELTGKLSITDDYVFWDGHTVSLDALTSSLTAGSFELFAETDEMLFNDTIVITRIVPDIASAGTDSQVTIYGTGFGDSERYGKVEFFYREDEPRIKASTILSWSDTEIICTVPTGIVNDYAASAGSGPVTVTTRSGTSNEYPFKVTFGYDNQYWLGDNPVISYYVNENTHDCIGEGAAVQAATETWNQTSPGLLFQYAGSHTNTQTSKNGLNEVMWGSTSSNALAVTYFWTRYIPDIPGGSLTTREIIECDMVFNDRADWSTNPSVREADVQSIALHEFGHFLCLTDLYGDIGDSEYDAAKVMYGYSDGSTLKRNLHPDDIAGIHWIYPPNSPPESPDAIDYPTEDDGDYTIIWNTSSAASSYQLERSLDGGDWIQIYSGPHTYFDETVEDGNYRYRVAASNSAGASDWQTGDWDCFVDSVIWEGSGEPNDPFLVGTAEQLDRIGTQSRWWNKHFKLTADIDLSEYDGQNGRPTFHIIAQDDESERWTGVFDGNDYIISNLTYTPSTSGHAGLFGCIDDPNAQVKRLGLISSRVEHTDAGTNDRVGSLVGLLQDGSITACYAENANVSGKRRVGGLVGENVNGGIVNCHANASVSGTDDVGGLVGYNSGSVIASFSTGITSGSGWGVGGVAGSNNPQGRIYQCYNRGAIAGNERVGGLVGENRKGEITQCYSTGSVHGDKGYIGGLAGDNVDGIIEASFWDIETSGQSTSDGGTGKTTIQMQSADTYLEAGWDFVNETENGTEDIWWIDEGNSYPRLWGEER